MAYSHALSQASGNFTGTVTVFNSQGTATTAAASNLVRPANWNSIHNEFYTLSGNINAGAASTVSGTNIILGASGAISISGNSNSIIFNAPIQQYFNENCRASFITWIGLSNSTSLMRPINLGYAISCNYLRLFQSNSLTVPAAFATTANTTLSASAYTTVAVAFYTQNTGASSQSLSMLTSQSAAFSFYPWLSCTTTDQYTYGYSLSYPTLGTTSTTQQTLAATSASFSFATTAVSNVGLNRFLDVPINYVFPEGNYWMLIGSSNSSNGNATLASLSVSGMIIGISQINSSFAPLGIAASVLSTLSSGGQAGMLGYGLVSSTTSTPPNAIALSQISLSNNSNPVPIFAMHGLS